MEQYESTKRTVRPGSKKLKSLDRSEDQWKSRKIAVFGPQCAHTREETQSLGCAGCPSVFFIRRSKEKKNIFGNLSNSWIFNLEDYITF